MNQELTNYAKEIENLIKVKQFEEAENIINQYIKKNKFLDISYYALGRIYLFKNKGDKSIKFYSLCLAENKNFYQAYLGLGLGYVSEKKYKDALSNLTNFLEKDKSNITAINALAHCYYKIEEYKKSLSYHKQSLNLLENQPNIIFGTATVLMHLEDYDEAIIYFKKLQSKENNLAPYFINYGKTLSSVGKFDEAKEIYSSGLNLFKDNVSLLTSMGSLLCDMNEYDLAENYLVEALKIDKENFFALVNAGTLFYKKNKYPESLYFYRKAYDKDPKNHILLNNISATQMELSYTEDGLLEEAIKNAKESIKYNSLYSKAYNNLSKCFYLLEDIDEALKIGLKAMSLNPNDGMYANNIGNCYKAKGDLDNAEHYYRNALKLLPTCSEAFLSLSYMGKIKRDEEMIKISKKIIEEEKLSEQDLGTLCYGLYKFYEKEKSFDKAFLYLKKANQFYSLIHNIGVEEYNESLKNQIKIKKKFYNKDNIKELGKGGSQSKVPIFIVGMQRSGTTLLEQILSNHPKIHGAGELTTIGRLVKNNDIENEKLSSNEFINNFNLQKRSELGDHYISSLNKYLTNDNQYVINKMPPNYLHLGFVNLTLPNSKIIHIKRDPLDNCFSLYAVRFHRGHEFSNNFSSIVETYQRYEEIMHYWEKLFPNMIYNIKYEDLVKNMEKEIKKVLKFCEIEFHSDCLNYHNNERIVLTASSTQVREKINSSGIERWKNYESELKPLTNLLKKRKTFK